MFFFCFVFKKDPVGRGKLIIKLAVFVAPQKGYQKATGYKKADYKQNDQCTHDIELNFILRARMPLKE